MPKVGGRWASGLPYLDGAVKRADARAAGLWLELRQLHVEALKARSMRSAGLCMPCCWLQGRHADPHAPSTTRPLRRVMLPVPSRAPAAVGCSALRSTSKKLVSALIMGAPVCMVRVHAASPILAPLLHTRSLLRRRRRRCWQREMRCGHQLCRYAWAALLRIGGIGLAGYHLCLPRVRRRARCQRRCPFAAPVSALPLRNFSSDQQDHHVAARPAHYLVNVRVLARRRGRMR